MMSADVDKLPWSPSIEGWSVPPLLEATATSPLHARVSSSVLVPRCGAALPPGAANWHMPEWLSSRIPSREIPTRYDLETVIADRVCRDCFVVYEQDPLW